MSKSNYTPIPLIQQCTRCKREYPSTNDFFCRNKKALNGLASWCKNCEREYAQYRRDNDREWYTTKRLRYLEKNGEKLRQQSRDYYAANREELKAQHRVYKPKWVKANPDKAKAQWLRRQALKRALPSDYTDADWQYALEFFDNKCVYCNQKAIAGRKFDADHYIPLSSPECPGTIPENILPSCRVCNRSKSDKVAIDWMVMEFGDEKGRQIELNIAAYLCSLKSRNR